MLEVQGAMHAGAAAAARCVLLIAGVGAALVFYGALQERIMAYPYGDEYFSVSVLLVFCNRLLAASFAAAMLGFRGEPWRLDAPLWHYLLAAVPNVAASACQYEALCWVILPVQILSKSFRTVPTLLCALGGPSKRRRGSWREWLLALATAAGCVAFCMAGPIAAQRAGGAALPGLLLLGAFLFLDAQAASLHEKFFAHEGPPKYTQMLYVNLAGAVACAPLLALHDTLRDSAMGFVERHATFAGDALVLSLASLAAQLCAGGLAAEFGAAICGIAMCGRQVASVLCSYHVHGHAETPLQRGALCLVFVPLLLGSYFALFEPRGPRRRTLGECTPLFPSSEDALEGGHGSSSSSSETASQESAKAKG